MEETSLCTLVETKGTKDGCSEGRLLLTHPGLHSNYKEGSLETSVWEGGQTQDPMLAGLNMPVREVLVARGNGCFLFSSLIPLNKTEVKQEGSEALPVVEKSRPQMRVYFRLTILACIFTIHSLASADQCWVFFARTDVEAETPILWPPGVKS